MLPEQYSLSGIYPDQDGVRLEAADQESADVLLRHPRASGRTVTASPIWPIYSFASPPSLSNRFTPEQIVAGLILQEVTRQRVEKDPRRGRPGDWSGWTSTRTHSNICVRLTFCSGRYPGLSASVKPQETSVLRNGRKTLVRGQKGFPTLTAT